MIFDLAYGYTTEQFTQPIQELQAQSVLPVFLRVKKIPIRRVPKCAKSGAADSC